MKNVIKSILAGILIGIGGSVFLSLYSKNYFLGSFLFSFGLFFICFGSLNLYTGKIGYLFEYSKKDKLNLLVILFCNMVTIFIFGMLIRLTKNSAIIDNSKLLLENKINDNNLAFFIKSIFCGMMMILAVEGYKKFDNVICKIIAIVFAVVIFIFCGFEHSIANMLYIGINFELFSINLLVKIILMILGNTIGSIALYQLLRISFN